MGEVIVLLGVFENTSLDSHRGFGRMRPVGSTGLAEGSIRRHLDGWGGRQSRQVRFANRCLTRQGESVEYAFLAGRWRDGSHGSRHDGKRDAPLMFIEPGAAL